MKSLIRTLAGPHDSSKVSIVLAAAFLFSFSSSSAVLAQLNFAPAVTYSSGGYYAISVAVADVNGDGKLDLVVANYCASWSAYCYHGAVSVLLGNGDGTFQTAIAYDSGGSSTISVAVADVNGDGKPDLLVESECASRGPNGCRQDVATATGGVGVVGVLFGNGDGTFQTVVTYDSGGYGPQSVVAADVNGDGMPDLVVASNCVSYPECENGIVGVLLNKGNGTL
jgi:FG-GAP-like repeat